MQVDSQLARVNVSSIIPINLDPSVNLSLDLLSKSLNKYVNYMDGINASRTYTAWIATALLTIIAVFGLVGNFLIIWAFHYQAHRGIISSFLILLLACVDSTICLISIPTTLYFDIWVGPTIDIVCRLQIAFKGFIVPFSACLLMVIATERFFLICFVPSIKFRRRDVTTSLFIIAILCGTLAIPMGLHSGVSTPNRESFGDVLLDLDFHLNVTNPTSESQHATNRQVQQCSKDESFIDDETYWYYQVSVFCFFVLLFFLLGLIYMVIFLFVWRHESLMYMQRQKGRPKCLRRHTSQTREYDRNRDHHPSNLPFHHLSEPRVDLLNNAHRPETSQRSTIYDDRPLGTPIGSSFSVHPLEPCVVNALKDSELRCACSCDQHSSSCTTTTDQSKQMMHNSRPHVLQAPQVLLIIPSETTFSDNVTPSMSKDPPSITIGKAARNANDNDISATHKRSSSINLIQHMPSSALGGSSILSSDSTNNPSATSLNRSSLRKICKSQSEVDRRAITSFNHSFESNRKPHVRTAQTLAMIASAFIVSYTPYLVLSITPVDRRAYSVLAAHQGQNVWLSAFRRVSFYLYFVNSAVNPVIYSFMNRYFQSRLRILKERIMTWIMTKFSTKND